MTRHNGLLMRERATIPPPLVKQHVADDVMHCLVCLTRLARHGRPFCLEHSEYAQKIKATVERQGRRRGA